MSLTVEEVIATYMKLKGQKEAIEGEVKEKVAAIKQSMDKIEAWLKVQADAQGVTSFKTKAGTAFVTTTDYANVSDWDATLEFIKTNDRFEMLEKRVSKTAVREYIAEAKEVPPGVTYGTKIEMNIRKPAAKAED